MQSTVNTTITSFRNVLKIALCSTAIATLASCGFLQDRRDENKGIQLESLKVPNGYEVKLFAKDLPKARHMAMGKQGTLFVGSTAGQVYALSMQNNAVVKQQTIITGLAPSGGISFQGNALFVTDRTRILRYDDIESSLDAPPSPKMIMDGFPDKARHSSLTMAFGPDAKLYVSVGSPCDSCESSNDEYGVILRSNTDGSSKEVVARGIRNSVGFDWHPSTKELWFTDNGSDALGPNRPNDELNRVSKSGENFGFPYCHDASIPDPEFGAKRSCSEFTQPIFGIGAHVAALGMKFSGPHASNAGDSSILIARHGSHPPIRVGYDVVKISIKAGSDPVMEPLLTGFLQGKSYWGRPVDILILSDGSVLVSDDLNGAIYRISKR